MTDPLRQLQIINARENAAHQALSKLGATQPDFGGDGIFDCEDYAASKKFAPDWPLDAQGNAIPSQDYNVTLPNGELHRVLVVPYQGKNWVMDNYSGNALLTKEDWEHGGWKFEPYTAPKLNTAASQTPPQAPTAATQPPRGMLGLGLTANSPAPR